MQTNVAGVQFQRIGKIYDFSYASDLTLKVGDEVLVEGEKGHITARVCILKFEVTSNHRKTPLKSVVRQLSQQQPSQIVESPQILQNVNERVAELKIDMTVIACHKHISSKKIIIFFTAPKRVDFRKLIKILAAQFTLRIELRQVGPRDETKIISGIGICGRQYCCSSFLREFVPVSIKMAKNQNLALNPSQVSGGCGKLLCCLAYEDDVYTSLRTQLPKVGSRVEVIESGMLGTVSGLDVLNQQITVKSSNASDRKRYTFTLEELRMQTAPHKAKKQRPGSRDLQDDWGDDMDINALIHFQKNRAIKKKN